MAGAYRGRDRACEWIIMETDLIHIFGVGYDLISMKYDIVDNSNYIDERLVHEWAIWRDSVDYDDTLFYQLVHPFHERFNPRYYLSKPFPMNFPGHFVVEDGDIDEAAS